MTSEIEEIKHTFIYSITGRSGEKPPSHLFNIIYLLMNVEINDNY